MPDPISESKDTRLHARGSSLVIVAAVIVIGAGLKSSQSWD